MANLGMKFNANKPKLLDHSTIISIEPDYDNPKKRLNSLELKQKATRVRDKAFHQKYYDKALCKPILNPSITLKPQQNNFSKVIEDDDIKNLSCMISKDGPLNKKHSKACSSQILPNDNGIASLHNVSTTSKIDTDFLFDHFDQCFEIHFSPTNENKTMQKYSPNVKKVLSDVFEDNLSNDLATIFPKTTKEIALGMKEIIPINEKKNMIDITRNLSTGRGIGHTIFNNENQKRHFKAELKLTDLQVEGSKHDSTVFQESSKFEESEETNKSSQMQIGEKSLNASICSINKRINSRKPSNAGIRREKSVIEKIGLSFIGDGHDKSLIDSVSLLDISRNKIKSSKNNSCINASSLFKGKFLETATTATLHEELQAINKLKNNTVKSKKILLSYNNMKKDSNDIQWSTLNLGNRSSTNMTSILHQDKQLNNKKGVITKKDYSTKITRKDYEKENDNPNLSSNLLASSSINKIQNTTITNITNNQNNNNSINISKPEIRREKLLIKDIDTDNSQYLKALEKSNIQNFMYAKSVVDNGDAYKIKKNASQYKLNNNKILELNDEAMISNKNNINRDIITQNIYNAYMANTTLRSISLPKRQINNNVFSIYYIYSLLLIIFYFSLIKILLYCLLCCVLLLVFTYI